MTILWGELAAWHGLATCRSVCMYVCRLAYAFRRRVEMHCDFTGGVDSMIWLGLASGGQIQVTV